MKAYLILDRFAEWLERNSRAAILAFSAIFLSVTCLLGATKLMEFDEIFTYYPARQPEPRQVWSFFADGLDAHTPVLALMVHASLSIFGDNHLALRLPVILGYWMLCLSIYAFVSFRCSRVWGMAAMLLPPVTSVYFYATQIRPYGLVLGVSAFALVCWQRATDERRRPIWIALLCAALALCVALHYFAVFLWIPFGLAGLVRDWRNRRIDWVLWIALAVALFPFAVFFPILWAARQNFLSGIWSPPRVSDIENTYRTILTLAFAPLLGTVAAWVFAGRGKAESLRPSAPAPEWVLVSGLALAPFYVVPAMLLAGTFVARYVLFTLTGLTLVLAMAAYRRARGDPRFAVVAIICLGGWFLFKYPNMARRQAAESGGLPFAEARPFENKSWMRAIEERPGVPVVINPAVFFLPFQHYSIPEVEGRAYYLTSLEDALRLDGTDTGDRNLILFRRRFALNVVPYADFTGAHGRFLLCVETTNPTWVVEKLLQDRAELRLILRQGTVFLYDVILPSPG